MKKEEWDRLLKQILNDLKGQEKEARSGFLLRLKWASGWAFLYVDWGLLGLTLSTTPKLRLTTLSYQIPHLRDRREKGGA